MSIKRIITCIKADINFQFKNGFYFVYVILLILYFILLDQFNKDIIKIALPIIIYIDPSILGMFFIGGMVLLEKQQGILALLHISPLSVNEYLISKLFTLSLISILVGVILALTTYDSNINYFVLVIGIFLTAIKYTLIGLLIASGARSINSYFIRMIPWMLAMIIPCFSLILKNGLFFFNLFPSVASLRIVFAAFINTSTIETIFNLLYILIINFILYRIVKKIFESKMIFEE